MLADLRERVATFLAAHEVCVVSAGGEGEISAMPVHYRSRGLALNCLLPRWADLAYDLEEDPRVLVVIPDGDDAGRHWLQCQGTARPVTAPDWGAFQQENSEVARPDKLYLVLRITSERIDLVDERHGWSRREKLGL